MYNRKWLGSPPKSGFVTACQPIMTSDLDEVVMTDNYYHGMPWVSVDKRLPKPLYPEKYLPLLICLNHRTFVCGGYEEGRFWLDGKELDNVTHWQYVPLVPERGGLVE